MFQFNITLCIVLLFAAITLSHSRRAGAGPRKTSRLRSRHRSGKKLVDRSADESRSCEFLDNIMCDELMTPTEGTMVNTGRRFEDKATYSCNPGFELNGESTLTCLSSGSWSGAAPQCVPIPIGSYELMF